MSKNKTLKRIEAALKRIEEATAVDTSGVEFDLKIERVTPKPPTSTKPIAHWVFGNDEWVRPDPNNREHAVVHVSGDVDFYAHGGLTISETKTFPSVSEAMLAADEYMRADGVVLPDTVVLGKDSVEYIGLSSDDCAWCHSFVYAAGCSAPKGRATTITEALDVLDANGIDTAIARQQLRERDEQAAAWDSLNVRCPPTQQGTVPTAGYMALKEPTDPESPKPLDGVVLTGGWYASATSGSSSVMYGSPATGVLVEYICGAFGDRPRPFIVWQRGHCIATGIGTREDAISKAVDLGATVQQCQS